MTCAEFVNQWIPFIVCTIHLLRVQCGHESYGTRFNDEWPEQEKYHFAFLHGWYESVLFGGIRNMYGSTGD